MSNNSREFTRTDTNLHVEVRGAEGVMIEGCVKDISEKLVSIITERLLPMGKECTVVFLFQGEAEEMVRLSLSGVVSQAEGDLMAVTFTELDEEKMDVLRIQILEGPYARQSQQGQRPSQYFSR